MNLLGLLSSSNLASTNGPNRLVSNNNLRPVLDLLLDSLQLGCDHIDSLVALPLFEALTTAEDNANAAIQSSLRLRGNE